MKKLTKPKPIWITLILSLFIHFFLISRFNYLLEVSSNEKIRERSHAASITLKLEAAPSPTIKNSKAPKVESIPDLQNIENRPTEKEILYEEGRIFSKVLPVEKIIQNSIDKKEVSHPSVVEKREVQEETIKDFPKKSSTDRVIKEEKPQSPAEAKEEMNQIKQEPKKELMSNKMISAGKTEEKSSKEDEKNSVPQDQPDKDRKIRAETERSLAVENKEMEKEAEQGEEQNFSNQNKKNEHLKEKPIQEEPHIASQEADNKDEDQGEKNLEIEEALDFTGNNYPDNVNPPELLEFQRPLYPKNLRERDIEGKVTLKVLIDKDGKVKEVQVFESSGYEAFDQIAVKSVRKWQFKPAKKGNQVKESWVLIPINFQIK